MQATPSKMNVGKTFNDTMVNIKGSQADKKRISDLRVKTPESINELEWLSGSGEVLKNEEIKQDSVARVRRSPSDTVEMSFPDDGDFVEQGDMQL